nr:hypothetical protein [Halorussus marinus]
MFESFGHFVYEIFLHDGSEKSISHFPNDDVLVTLLVELAFQFILQPGIEVLDRSLPGVERPLFSFTFTELSSLLQGASIGSAAHGCTPATCRTREVTAA